MLARGRRRFGGCPDGCGRRPGGRGLRPGGRIALSLRLLTQDWPGPAGAGEEPPVAAAPLQSEERRQRRRPGPQAAFPVKLQPRGLHGAEVQQ